MGKRYVIRILRWIVEQILTRELCALNNAFYGENAASFSATREAPWPGWRRVLCNLGPWGSATNGEKSPLSVLDVACGNLRFERFLDDEYAGSFSAIALDSCDELALSALRDHDFTQGSVEFHHVDILQPLLDCGTVDFCSMLGDVQHDAAVCFGFMHHVPGTENRRALLRALVRSVRSEGIVAVSLWRFAEDESGALKAQTTDARAFAQMPELGWHIHEAGLEPGDHFLGWKNMSGVWRYCHSFSDEEIQELMSAIADQAVVVDRFFADGKTNTMNAYLILRRLD